MAQQIRLNMAPGSLPEVFRVSQGDKGRELTAVLEDGGTAFVIPQGATAKLVGTKPSGLGFQITATCAGNIVTIITETTMTNEHGRIPAEIRITDANELRIGTANVVIDVEPDPHPDNTTDGDAEELINEITELVNRAENAQEAAETAQGKAEDAQTAAETAQGKAEDAQTAAETAQGKAEDAQSAAETAQGKAETAQGKAEDAQSAAETAQGKAEDAQTAAETAQGKAEDAQEAAEAAAESIHDLGLVVVDGMLCYRWTE